MKKAQGVIYENLSPVLCKKMGVNEIGVPLPTFLIKFFDGRECFLSYHFEGFP